MIGLAALVCTARLGAQTPTGTVDGWKITVRTTTDSGGLEHKHWMTSTMHVAGHFVRTELPDAPIPPGPSGIRTPTMISDDSTHTTIALLENVRSAMVTPIGSSIQLSATNDSTSRFIVAPAMTTRDLGAGEPILGHPTHKYTVTLAYVAQTTLLGSPCKKTVNSVETIWTATDLQRVEQLRKYVHDSRLAGGEFGPVGDSLRKLNLHRERLINGLILRSQTVLTKPSAGGATTKVTMTMEVLDLFHGPIPRAMFVVPAGYKMLTRPTRMPVDSARLKARRESIDASLAPRMHALVCDPDPAK